MSILCSLQPVTVFSGSGPNLVYNVLTSQGCSWAWSFIRSSPQTKCLSVRLYVHTYVHMSTMKHNVATNQIVVFVKVDETFTMIWLSRSFDVRVKVRRWPLSPIWTIFY